MIAYGVGSSGTGVPACLSAIEISAGGARAAKVARSPGKARGADATSRRLPSQPQRCQCGGLQSR